MLLNLWGMITFPNKIIFIGENYVIRLKQSLSSLILLAGVLLDHEDLWHWNLRSLFKLSCLILLAFNGSPAGKDRKVN
jgi:hypothetical protein